jgi:hypothetical protein
MLSERSGNNADAEEKNEIIRAAMERVDQNKIQKKFMKYPKEKIQKQQDGKLDAIFNKNANRLIKIEYYDTLLNSERKVDHFVKLFNKIRLRVIHKPFIIMDMLKLMPDEQTSVYLLSSLYNKLRKMRQRKAFDQIIYFVEYKKNLILKLADFAKRLTKNKNQKFMRTVGNRIDQEVRVKRKNQILRRSLKYFGTLLNNIIREKKKDTLGTMILKLQLNGNTWSRRREHKLGIQENRGFVIQKRGNRNDDQEISFNVMNFNHKKQGNNSRYTKNDSDMRTNGLGDTGEFENEKNAFINKSGTMNDARKKDHSPDRSTGKKKNDRNQVAMSFGSKAGMNILSKKDAFYDERGQLMNHNGSGPSTKNNSVYTNSNNMISSKISNPMDGSLPIKNVFNKRTGSERKGDLLNMIKREIMDINEQMQKDERDPNQDITLPQRIELLNRLGKLMELLKKYYEAQRRRGSLNEDMSNKKNFEQVLILVKRLMETLLKKMSDDLINSQINYSQNKIGKEGTVDLNDDMPVAEDDHRSLARIDMMTRQLTKDLENLIPPTYEFETLGNTNHGSISYDPRDKEFQSISAINNLLQEVVQNLNNINENMDQNNILIEDGNSQMYSGIKNSTPISYSDGRTDGSKYGDYIEQSQNKGGLYNRNFMRRRNTSKLTNESDFKNSTQKNNYDPAFQINLDESKGLSMEMLNFLGVFNFKLQKNIRKRVEKSFDALFYTAVTDELMDRFRILAKEIKKEDIFLSIAKLGVETNRRTHIKNQTMYRLSQALFTKKKWALRILRSGASGVPFDPNNVKMADVNAYFSKCFS